MRLLLKILIFITLSFSVQAKDINKTNEIKIEQIKQIKDDVALMTAWKIARGDMGIIQKAVLFDKAIRQYLISKELIDKDKWKVEDNEEK